MSELREIAYSQYAEHYNALNKAAGEDGLSKRQQRNLDVTFGNVLSTVPSDGTVLDLGCGAGIFLQWIDTAGKFRLHGVDLNPEQIQAASKRLPKATLECGDGFEYLSDRLNTFDAIFCFDVLEHIEGDDNLLKWLRHVKASLKENGVFVCRAPNASNLTGGHGRYIDLTHERAFTSTSMMQLLRAAGFQDTQIVPIKAGTILGKVRASLELLIHRALFVICNRSIEAVFTTNVCGMARKVSNIHDS